MIAIDRSKCTACGACLQACPKKCILMTNDKFERTPFVDFTQCVSCGKCSSVCPIDKDIKMSDIGKAYAAVNMDVAEIMKESSGGVFGSIAKYVLSMGGVVYGCTFQKMKAQHIRIDKIEELDNLYGSKYVQSDTCSTYIQVAEDLEKGIVVLYSATPCQIAGLKMYLGNHDYQNLLTVDIICHGVPSQAYFDKFVNGLQCENNMEIAAICFRDKARHSFGKNGTYVGNYSGIYTATQKCFVKTFPYFKHYYYYYFLIGAAFRESCYQCAYADLKRVSDITIGDLWGEEQFRLKFDTKQGCSLVIVNTVKGERIFRKLSIYTQEIDIEVAAKYNLQLRMPLHKPTDYNVLREQFYVSSYLEMQKYFETNNRWGILKARISYCIPKSLKRLLKKMEGCDGTKI